MMKTSKLGTWLTTAGKPSFEEGRYPPTRFWRSNLNTNARRRIGTCFKLYFAVDVYLARNPSSHLRTCHTHSPTPPPQTAVQLAPCMYAYHHKLSFVYTSTFEPLSDEFSPEPRPVFLPKYFWRIHIEKNKHYDVPVQSIQPISNKMFKTRSTEITMNTTPNSKSTQHTTRQHSHNWKTAE